MQFDPGNPPERQLGNVHKILEPLLSGQTSFFRAGDAMMTALRYVEQAERRTDPALFAGLLRNLLGYRKLLVFEGLLIGDVAGEFLYVGGTQDHLAALDERLFALLERNPAATPKDVLARFPTEARICKKLEEFLQARVAA